MFILNFAALAFIFLFSLTSFRLTSEKTQLCSLRLLLSLIVTEGFFFFCNGPQNQTPIGGFLCIAGSDIAIQNKEWRTFYHFTSSWTGYLVRYLQYQYKRPWQPFKKRSHNAAREREQACTRGRRASQRGGRTFLLFPFARVFRRKYEISRVSVGGDAFFRFSSVFSNGRFGNFRLILAEISRLGTETQWQMDFSRSLKVHQIIPLTSTHTHTHTHTHPRGE